MTMMYDKRITEEAFLRSLMPMDNASPYLKAMIFGDSGVGKTVLSMTYGEKILYVDAVEGWVSLINHPKLRAKGTRVKYEGLSQLDLIATLALDGKLDYDTIVVDEASTIAHLDLDIVLKVRSTKDPDKDPSVPTQPDFFSNTERCRRTFMRLLKLPKNVILVAHMREDKDERTGVLTKRPGFSPKLRVTIEQACHLVAHMTADERGDDYIRKLQTLPTRGVSAKSRIGGLPRFIINPNLGELLKDWQEEEDKPQDMPPDIDAPVSEEVPEFEFGEN